MNWNKDLISAGDPIIELMRIYNNDTNPTKVNLGIGVYQNALGETPIFEAVKAAEGQILANEKTKAYIGVGGNMEFIGALQDAIFGQSKAQSTGIQTVGGSGALRVIAETCHSISDTAKVWVSNPTWANHFAIFGAAGIECKKYEYYDVATGKLAVDFENDMKDAQPGDYVIIHATCHNPTGIDLSTDDKAKLIEVINSKNLVPIFDAAYLGFKNTFENDCTELLEFIKNFETAFLAFSASKNLGLYRERTGAAFLYSQSAEKLEIWKSLALVAARTNYSMPPAHGAEVVKVILTDDNIRQSWISELDQARSRVNTLRKNFADKLSGKLSISTDFIENGTGLFCLLPLNKDQIASLREKQGIYLLGSGRVNVAGLSDKNMDFVTDAIISVL